MEHTFHNMSKLDEKDWKILNVLKDHSEYSTREISKKTNLPITTIHHRIKRLQEEKVIKKFTIEIDSQKSGKDFVAYVLISANLEFLKQKKKSQYDLAKEIKSLSFTERVDIVSGGTDMIAILRVKDVQEFDKVLLGKIQAIEGIEKTQSLIVIHSE